MFVFSVLLPKSGIPNHISLFPELFLMRLFSALSIVPFSPEIQSCLSWTKNATCFRETVGENQLTITKSLLSLTYFTHCLLYVVMYPFDQSRLGKLYDFLSVVSIMFHTLQYRSPCHEIKTEICWSLQLIYFIKLFTLLYLTLVIIPILLCKWRNITSRPANCALP